MRSTGLLSATGQTTVRSVVQSVYFGRVMTDLYFSWGAGVTETLWQLAGADSVLALSPAEGEFTEEGAHEATAP